MKKFLLSLVAIVATMNAFADNDFITKKFSPMSSAEGLAGIHAAVAADGSTYASSTTDQDFTFGSTTIERDNNAIYSCVVKYDKAGTEKWAALINGSSTVTAMTTDADGNVYIGGTFKAATMSFKNADGTSTVQVTGSADVTSGFVAKLNAEGVFQAANAFTPQVDAEVAAGFNPIFECPAYSEDDWTPMTVSPQKIIVNGDKVYISALYRGDIPSIGWEGHYTGATYDMGMGYIAYYDLAAHGLFSLNKSDLKSPASLATVGSTELIIEETNYNAKAFSFVINEGKVYVAFIGWGNISLVKSATDKKDFEFTVSTDPSSSANEYAMVIANLDNLNQTKIFNTTPYELSWGAVFNLFSDVVNGKAIIGGTFEGSFPLNKEVVKNQNTTFIASINFATAKTEWSWINEEEETSVAKGLLVTGEETHFATEGTIYHFKTASGTSAGDSAPMSVLDAAQINDQYVVLVTTETTDEKAEVVVMLQEMKPSGIEAIKAAAAKGETTIYNLNGQRVATPQKGLYIVNGRAAVVK